MYPSVIQPIESRFKETWHSLFPLHPLSTFAHLPRGLILCLLPFLLDFSSHQPVCDSWSDQRLSPILVIFWWEYGFDFSINVHVPRNRNRIEEPADRKEEDESNKYFLKKGTGRERIDSNEFILDVRAELSSKPSLLSIFQPQM